MFVFHDAKDILKIDQWNTERQRNPGGPGGVIAANMLVNALEAEINFERARIWARAHTTTGLRVMDAVRKSAVKIHVIAWRSSNPMQPGFSMFSNDSPRMGEGTIFVNLDQFVQVATPNPEDANKSRTLNNFVLILHEVGHAKQFIDNATWFRSNEGTGTYVAPFKAALTEVMTSQTGKSWGHSGKIDRILGNAHKAFSSAIEWDNYIYHEGPICDEIGVARRISYSNIAGGFGTTHTGGSVS